MYSTTSLYSQHRSSVSVHGLDEESTFYSTGRCHFTGISGRLTLLSQVGSVALGTVDQILLNLHFWYLSPAVPSLVLHSFDPPFVDRHPWEGQTTASTAF